MTVVMLHWSTAVLWTERLTREIPVMNRVIMFTVRDLLFDNYLQFGPSSSFSRHYNLTVQATDNGSPNMSATVVIYITVTVS